MENKARWPFYEPELPELADTYLRTAAPNVSTWQINVLSAKQR